MPRTSPFRSGAFRFVLLVAAIFALGTLALLVMVERTVSQYAAEVAHDSITTEVSILLDEDRLSGRAQAIQSVTRRENAVREHQLRFLLVDSRWRYLAGSLPAEIAHIGWRTIKVPNHDADNDERATTMTLATFGARMSDGAVVVVGSDTSDIEELRQNLGVTTGGFGMLIVLLALGGGFIVGTTFLRRLDRVNLSVARIMQGSLEERLPQIGMSPEFDRLSVNLNLMLGRIEALMDGVKQVSTDIAHDLRTPLTRLRQQLEDMRDTAPTQLTIEQAERALIQIDQILSIFRALLRISSLEAGAARKRFGPVDVSEMIELVFHAYQPVAEDQGHNLSAKIEPGVVAFGDAEMLAQAVTNLIENALFHTPRGTGVAVGVEQNAGGGVTIFVSDNGPGIPPGEARNVVKRFYRLDSSRGSEGAGLGLSLAAAITNAHGAKLVLADNDPGLKVEIRISKPLPKAALDPQEN
jgi:signal transduction histidine kinase